MPGFEQLTFQTVARWLYTSNFYKTARCFIQEDRIIYKIPLPRNCFGKEKYYTKTNNLNCWYVK
jgi:hypothetical protein